MKRTFALAIAIFCITFSNAQITDSKRDSTIVDKNLLTNEIDTIIVDNGIDSLKIDQLKLTEHVIYLGYISDRQLCYLYNKTEAFVFPSFYEGFGFPIVEAFCCGAPVVTSNISSCPEIAGEAALKVNPSSPGDIAEAISRIIGDDALKDQMRSKGKKRADDFDFRKTAQETLEVYKEVHNGA